MDDQSDTIRLTYPDIFDKNTVTSNLRRILNVSTEYLHNINRETEACSGDASSPSSDRRYGQVLNQKPQVSAWGDYLQTRVSSGSCSSTSVNFHSEVVTVQAEIHSRLSSPVRKLHLFYPFRNPKPGPSSAPDNVEPFLYPTIVLPVSDDQIEPISETITSSPSICDKDLPQKSLQTKKLYPVQKKNTNRIKLLRFIFRMIMLVLFMLMTISILWTFIRSKFFTNTPDKREETPKKLDSYIKHDESMSLYKIPTQSNNTKFKLPKLPLSLWMSFDKENNELTNPTSSLNVLGTKTPYRYSNKLDIKYKFQENNTSFSSWFLDPS